MPKIMMVDDDKLVTELLQKLLRADGFDTVAINDSSKAIDLAKSEMPDLILLDLMMPQPDGFRLCRMLREEPLFMNTPIIIVTALDDSDSRAVAFGAGATDYLTKPFHLSELLVRIQALIRRKNFKGNNLVAFNEIEIDILSKTVRVSTKKIDITKKEIDLLLYLIGNENRVLSKSAIAEHLSGDMADMLDNHDFVYAHIKNLKNKLKEAGCSDYIKTVYGLGYKWQND